MTKTVFKLALVTFVTLSVAACAGKKEEVVTPPPAVTEQPTPTPTPYTPPKADTTPLPPSGPVPGSQQDFVVNVGDRVFFDLDQSSVREDAKAILDKQAAWLVRYPAVKVRIEGNADERGTREYNFALGARRAEAVSQYLTSKGVVPSRISTISYGKENPLSTGTDEEAWAQNRNAHTALIEGAQ
ncbi:peptidoglycan-associated lipoprotein Pal [Asticcacaulis sp. AND118]|uniref:peptidoglycan-associated lipoprotein Pal n=1 Tax=Asticcacaulis sp. AND118 TaxID=2840468 RepID=UPI001CFF736E|nr:peptidoglycan-associated lipoprotein Pal [Asticcacaulis sp. AND118]UDF02833.1 peptidoglycan-associated lipoprotein Pal [Asticcacaulis sp. AND118]